MTLADDQELIDVVATGEEIRQSLRSDGEFFIEFFVGEHIDSAVPKFHIEIWQLLTNTALDKVLLAIPRGHAKTTLAKLAIVWYFLHTTHRFAIYLSSTNAIALGACKDVVDYIQSPNFEAVYGKVEIITANTTHSLWVFDLPMPDGKTKRCILRALGANQQVRGININNQRPDIAVIDDVEDNDNTESEILQKKLDLWIFGPFLKALSKNPKIIWLGNMLKDTSLLARLSRQPEWNAVVFGSIVKDAVTGEARPLWPDRWSLKALLEDYQAYKVMGLSASWLCEMMNMPGHLVNGFGPESLHYAPVPPVDAIRAAWLTLDVAYGLETQHDESAVVVHVLPENGIPMVADYWHGKVDESELFLEVLRLAAKWNAWVWGIESVAGQRLLIPLFRMKLAERFMVDQVQMLPMISGRGEAKVSRIRAWASLMGSDKPSYAIPDWDVDIGTQLLSYDVRTIHNRDDLIDACAYGPIMFDKHLNLLVTHYMGEHMPQAEAQFGRRIADV